MISIGSFGTEEDQEKTHQNYLLWNLWRQANNFRTIVYLHPVLSIKENGGMTQKNQSTYACNNFYADLGNNPMLLYHLIQMETTEIFDCIAEDYHAVPSIVTFPSALAALKDQVTEDIVLLAYYLFVFARLKINPEEKQFWEDKPHFEAIVKTAEPFFAGAKKNKDFEKLFNQHFPEEMRSVIKLFPLRPAEDWQYNFPFQLKFAGIKKSDFYYLTREREKLHENLVPLSIEEVSRNLQGNDVKVQLTSRHQMDVLEAYWENQSFEPKRRRAGQSFTNWFITEERKRK